MPLKFEELVAVPVHGGGGGGVEDPQLRVSGEKAKAGVVVESMVLNVSPLLSTNVAEPNDSELSPLKGPMGLVTVALKFPLESGIT